jgi:hypothetical protein
MFVYTLTHEYIIICFKYNDIVLKKKSSTINVMLNTCAYVYYMMFVIVFTNSYRDEARYYLCVTVTCAKLRLVIFLVLLPKCDKRIFGHDTFSRLLLHRVVTLLA